MKKRFQNILCPLDFGENSRVALETASALAQSSHGVVHLLHVIRPSFPPPPLGTPMEMVPPLTEVEAITKLERLAQEHVQGPRSCTVRIHLGDPATAILSAIRRLGVDSVVMATHGRKGLDRFLLGSVAERVIREASCPVLVVHPETTNESSGGQEQQS